MSVNLLSTDKILRRKLSDDLAVDVYFELMDGVKQRRITTREFQKKFNRFCMVRRDAKWQKVFYGLFAELSECRDAVTLKDVLPELDRRLKQTLKSERLEFSLATKMLAFLNPYESPIWDSWVVKNMREKYGLDLRLKKTKRDGLAVRESEALEKYQLLKKWFEDSISMPSVIRELNRFDNYLPQGFGCNIPRVKKLDWLLWAER